MFGNQKQRLEIAKGYIFSVQYPLPPREEVTSDVFGSWVFDPAEGAPAHNFTTYGTWTASNEHSERHLSLSGEDDQAIASSFLLVGHGELAAIALLDGTAISAAGVVPSSHPNNRYVPYTSNTMVVEAHQEGACQLRDRSQRLFAESVLGTYNSQSRVLPDYEAGGAGATSVATMVKHMARTRLGSKAQREALFILSDYAYVGQRDADPQASITGNNKAGLRLETPLVLIGIVLDTVIAVGRSALAFMRGAWLLVQFAYRRYVVAPYYISMCTPSPAHHKECQSFIRAAGLGDEVTAEQLTKASAYHINTYYETCYQGLLASIANERQTPSTFLEISLLDLAKRVFAYSNVVQHGVIGRGGWRTSTLLWWSEGDIIPLVLATHKPVGSCESRDWAIYTRHQPAPMPTNDSDAFAAVSHGTALSSYFTPLAELIPEDPHGLVPLWRGGGYLASLIAAVPRVIARIYAPSPLCDPYDTTTVWSATPPSSSVPSLPPARRHLMNELLKKVFLLPDSFSEWSITPSPIVPYAERQRPLPVTSTLDEAIRPASSPGRGLHGSHLRSWLGTREVGGAATGASISLSGLMQISSDDSVYGYRESPFGRLGGFMSAIASLSLSASFLPWSGVVEELASWRWHSGDVPLQQHEGLAIHMGTSTVASRRSIVLTRGWVAMGTASIDADTPDVPIYWMRRGSEGAGERELTPMEESWGGTGGCNAPITDFIWSRYFPLASSRANIITSIPTSSPTCSAAGNNGYATSLFDAAELLSLQQLSSLLLSTLPEEASALYTPPEYSSATKSQVGPSATQSIERDLWTFLGQYDVLARLPARDTMETESATSALFAAKHIASVRNDLPHLMSISRSPRDSTLEAAYTTHRAEAVRWLNILHQHTEEFKSVAVDGLASEELKWEEKIEGGILLSLRTPISNQGGQSVAEWSHQVIGEALAERAQGSQDASLQIPSSHLLPLPTSTWLWFKARKALSSIVGSVPVDNSLNLLEIMAREDTPAHLQWTTITALVKTEAISEGSEPNWQLFSEAFITPSEGATKVLSVESTTHDLDPDLDAAFSALGYSIHHYWACSGLGTSLLYTASLLKSALDVEVDTATYQWSADYLASELSRYLAAVRMGTSLEDRSTYAEAGYLLGDPECIAGLASVLGQAGGRAVFGGDGVQHTANISILATYHARPAADGTVAWQVNSIILSERSSVTPRPPTTANDGPTPSGDHLPMLLSSLAIAVSRSHHRYEGTVAYAGAMTEATLTAEDWLFGGDDDDPTKSEQVLFGAKQFKGFKAPSFGLYRSGQPGIPRPLFLDCATKADSQGRSVNPTDPLIVRFRNATTASIAYPPYSAKFSFAKVDQIQAVLEGAGEFPTPHLTVEGEIMADRVISNLRPAPDPWPPRLGEGRSYFEFDGVLKRNSVAGIAVAAEWLQWLWSWF